MSAVFRGFLLFVRIAATAGRSVPLPSSAVLGAAELDFFGDPILRFGAGFGVLSLSALAIPPWTNRLSCFSSDSICSAIRAAFAKVLDEKWCTGLLYLLEATQFWRACNNFKLFRYESEISIGQVTRRNTNSKEAKILISYQKGGRLVGIPSRRGRFQSVARTKLRCAGLYLPRLIIPPLIWYSQRCVPKETHEKDD